MVSRLCCSCCCCCGWNASGGSSRRRRTTTPVTMNYRARSCCRVQQHEPRPDPSPASRLLAHLRAMTTADRRDYRYTHTHHRPNKILRSRRHWAELCCSLHVAAGDAAADAADDGGGLSVVRAGIRGGRWVVWRCRSLGRDPMLRATPYPWGRVLARACLLFSRLPVRDCERGEDGIGLGGNASSVDHERAPSVERGRAGQRSK